VARIDLVDVCKTLRDPGAGAGRPSTFAIQDLSLRVPHGKTMVVLGPSGCGKTTLLKIIAGLIRPDSGHVRYDDVDVNDVRPGDRRIGMVFQNYALYPHVTSRTNVLSYFLFRKKTPEMDAVKRAKYQRTSELMGVELAHLLDRMPPTLSGGEKQRVALGRCITRDAALFLVDEPFANLDQALREKYRVNLKALLRQFDITTVYVTHDHHEALILADLIAVMAEGRIAQVGTAREIYDAPVSAFVASFLNLHVGAPPISLLERDGQWIGVRPEDVTVARERTAGAVAARVAEAVRYPLGDSTLLTMRVGEHEVHALAPGNAPHAAGDPVWLSFRRYHVFERESGRRVSSHPMAA
jgi:ABC-type sugar transport system ATPase subunit